MRKKLMVWVGGSLMLLSASSGLGQGLVYFDTYSSEGGGFSGSLYSPISFGSVTNFTLWPGASDLGVVDAGSLFTSLPNLNYSGSSPVTLTLVAWTNAGNWYASAIGGSPVLFTGPLLPPATLPQIGSPQIPSPEIVPWPETVFAQSPSFDRRSRHGFRGTQTRAEQLEQQLERLLARLTRESNRGHGRHHLTVEEQIILIEVERLRNGRPVPPGDLPPLPPTELTPPGAAFQVMVPVPEPAASLLAATGGALLFLAARRKRKHE